MVSGFFLPHSTLLVSAHERSWVHGTVPIICMEWPLRTAGSGRGCVKTQNRPEFRGPSTTVAVEKIEYRAIYEVEC